MPHYEVTVSDTKYYEVLVDAASAAEAEELAKANPDGWVVDEHVKPERTFVAVVELERYTPTVETTMPRVIPS